MRLSGKQVGKETRQERREKQRIKQETKMPQHGKSLARIYQDTVSKRARMKKVVKKPK
jgi:hypothetical protein